jgi:hypothetical protein
MSKNFKKPSPKKNKTPHTQTLDQTFQNYADNTEKMSAVFKQCADKGFAYIDINCPEAARNVKNAPHQRCNETVKNGEGYKALIAEIDKNGYVSLTSVHPTIIKITVRPKPPQ